MSYGQQLNIFRAKAAQYGTDWRGVVMCKSAEQLKVATEDARDFLGGRYLTGTRTLILDNRARLNFFIVDDRLSADYAFRGRQYTHIIWLSTPATIKVRETARAWLRSNKVPSCEWRYEYALAL